MLTAYRHTFQAKRTLGVIDSIRGIVFAATVEGNHCCKYREECESPYSVPFCFHAILFFLLMDNEGANCC
jgi:hypothetical protein